jgi:hypothetical protein
MTPLELHEHCGSAIRGAFFQALLKRFCANRDAPTCAACSFIEACPVASLVAPLRNEQVQGYGYGQDAPRPYVILPPACQREQGEIRESALEAPIHNREGRRGVTFHAEEPFTFGLHLIGASAKLFPYVLGALKEMEVMGIGRPLAELKGARGRYRIQEVYAYHPLSGERQLLWQQGSTLPQKPLLCITDEDISRRAQQICSNHLTLQFVSPTRLVKNKQLLRRPDFLTFTQRLAERFEQLLCLYEQQNYTSTPLQIAESGERNIGGREWYVHISQQAQEIQLIRDETRWVDVTSYSARQRQSIGIGGFIGQATFQGNITSLRKLLAWGEVIGVGKSVTKGDGRYQIEG